MRDVVATIVRGGVGLLGTVIGLSQNHVARIFLPVAEVQSDPRLAIVQQLIAIAVGLIGLLVGSLSAWSIWLTISWKRRRDAAAQTEETYDED